MKKTRLLICLVLALVLVIGALPAFATEEQPAADTTVADGAATEETTEETTEEKTEETTEEVLTTGPAQPATPELSTDETCSGETAKNGKHSYEAWEMNDEAHWHRCKHCQKYFGGTHEGGDTFKSDSTLHWHYCNTCKKKYVITEHSFGEPNADYQVVCSVCNKVEDLPHEHHFEEGWSSNAFQHWHKCDATFGLRGSNFCKFAPENVSELGDHEYNEEGICVVCGAEDVVPDERPGDAGVKWIVIIVIGVVGAAAAAGVFLTKKKK